MDDLLFEGKRIGIWGLGYVGFSTMSHFAAKGVKCIGYDTNKETVERINKKELPYNDTMFYWIGFDTIPLVEKGLMQATNNYKDLFKDDVIAHLICVPTEKDGEPWDVPLLDISNKIIHHFKNKKLKQDYYIIIESTVSPDKVDEFVKLFEDAGLNQDDSYENAIYLGAAPRRDWFVSADKNLKTLPRIIGAVTPFGEDVIEDIYKIICDKVIPASGMKEAALVKSVENALRQLNITFANELALAYPDTDIREVLRLAATKWNIPYYHPSIGSGGYCLPLAPKYVLRGAKYPEMIELLTKSIESNNIQPWIISQEIIESGFKKIGIMGLSYTKNLKVDILSPSKKIANDLRKAGLDVRVNDPFYTDEEIKKLTGCEVFKYPDDLDKFDMVLVVNDHDQYKQVDKRKLFKKLNKVKFIMDNVGLWEKYRSYFQINYKTIGESNWLDIKS